MRIARFSVGDAIHYGALEDGSQRIVGLKGDPLFSTVEPSGKIFELDEVRLLSPVIPRSKVIGLGMNYYGSDGQPTEHTPDHPIMFFKPNTSVIGPDDPIVLPEWSTEVYFEAELAVVIKTLAKDVPVEDALSVVLGYTCANDLSAGDAQRADGQWSRGKGWDTSCPLGPWITVDPELNPDQLRVESRVDGDLRQSDSTSNMVFSVPELVSYLSHVCTLLPGDVILTGTPAGGGTLEAGQRIEVSVEGIGSLSNPVVRR